MVQNNHSAPTRKSRFSFGIKKKSSSDDACVSPTNASDIVQQLKALSEHLTALDRDLVINGGLLGVEEGKAGPPAPRLDASKMLQEAALLNRSNSSRCRRSSNSGGGAGGLLVDGELGVTRSNSLKSSMQKLAHKTLGKAGWYRGKKPSQGDSQEKDDGAFRPPSLSVSENKNPCNHAHHAPVDVIDLSRRVRKGWVTRDANSDGEEGGGVHETFLPPPSPFQGSDTCSLVSSPRSPGSVSSEKGRRHSTAGSLQSFYDDPKSPRQRMNADALAQIEVRIPA